MAYTGYTIKNLTPGQSMYKSLSTSTLNVRTSIEDLNKRVKRLEGWRETETIRLRRERTIMPDKEKDLEVANVSVEPVLTEEKVVNDQVTAMPSMLKLVYPELIKWLIEPTTRRIGTWSKIFSASNDVRQVLFERHRKATSKAEYEGGLKLDSGPDGLIEGVSKLADAIFFLFKFHKNKQTPDTRTDKVQIENQIKLAEDLVVLLNHLVSELRKQQ